MIAELSAIISFGVTVKNRDREIVLMPDHKSLDKKYLSLVKKTLNVTKEEARSLTEVSGDIATKVLCLVKINEGDTDYIDRTIIMQSCCKKAYIRGAFLSSGTITDPNKSYHFEITTKTKRQAEELKETIEFFNLKAGITSRKNHFVVYLKDSSAVADILAVMEANRSVLELENVKVVKEFRENINRKVNCETANIKKTVRAGVKQIEDIEFIEREIGLSELPDTLEEIARARLKYPDTSLTELGTYLSTPLGKSGVNHRLRRISKVAEQLRNQEE